MRTIKSMNFGSISRWYVRFVLCLVLLFMLFLLPSSFLYTTEMSVGTGRGEVVSFRQDNIFVNLISFLIMIFFVYLLWRIAEQRSMRSIYATLGVCVLLFGFLLVVSAKLQPSEDSYVLSFFAREAAKGDLSYYSEYFRFFPFQFGYVLYAELFFRFFYWLLPNAPEGFSSLALQGMNVLYTAFAYYALLRFSYCVFQDEAVCKLIAVLFILCLPAVYFVTFMYGNVPSFACVCAGLWAFAVFRRKGNWLSGLLCIVLLSLAVMLKLNSLIVVVAVTITALVCMLCGQRVRMLLFTAGLLTAVLLSSSLPQKCYETRLDQSFGDGIPQIGWLAMGLHEGESCSGWYSPQYTTTAYKDSGFDPETTKNVAKAAIEARMAQFAAEPEEALRFFQRKYLSQWNEPSYQGIWNNQVRGHYSEPGLLYELLCHRFARPVLAVMNAYQQMIFFAFTLGLFCLFRRGGTTASLLPLIILGGMLYHLLFEAKSQHAQGYFILMIPVAAHGLYWLFRLSRRNTLS